MGRYLIVTGDFRRTGGMDMANHALASFLARRGDEVHLVTYRVDEDLRGLPNVIVHRVPKPAGSYFVAAPLLDIAGRRWARRIARQGGRVIVNGGNCYWGDVNWVHYVHAAYRPRSAADPLRRAKVALEDRIFLRQEREVLRRARVVLANSNRTGRDLVERLGLPESIVHTVYYGIDPGRFGPITPEERRAARAHLGWPEDRPQVVFVGAMGDRRKGFDTLFEAWRRLCADRSWDADLVVVGAGAEVPFWKRQAADVALSDRFRFLGFTGEVPRVLAACDAMVHPVRYEAYGLGVHEALCRGLPALVSASAGVAELYPPELRDMLLPDPNDPEGLRERLRAWRNQMASYRDRVAPLAEGLRAYTWDDMAAAILRLVGEPS